LVVEFYVGWLSLLVLTNIAYTDYNNHANLLGTERVGASGQSCVTSLL